MKRLLIGAFLLLAACASGNDQASFFKAEAAYTALLQAAASYVALPRCNGANAPVCSEQKVVDQIRPAANSADASVQAAEDLVTSGASGNAIQLAVQAAQSATQALTVIMQQYNIKVN